MAERDDFRKTRPKRERRERRDPRSPLEKVFEFENIAFRDYITIHSQRDVPADRLYTLYEDMMPSNHPMVAYAAGWVLSELCTRNESFPNHSSRSRAIESIKRMWDKAAILTASELEKARVAKDMVKLEKYFALELDIRLAQAHIPTIEAVGHRIETGELREDLVNETYGNLMQLSSDLLNHPAQKQPDLAPHITGTLGESLASSLLHRAKPDNLMATPSSIRQQGMQQAALRSDLVGHEFSADRYRKYPIQVKTRPQEGENSYDETILVHVIPDLSFKNNPGAASMLEFLLKESSGGNKNGERAREVDEITAWFMDEIARHKHKPRKKQR